MAIKYPDNEESRLAVMALYEILDSGEDQAYDDLTKIAAYIAQTPIALITMVDRDRQWFKSKIGIAISETPREVSFCAHTILTPTEPMIVTDATKDERFASNPMVTGEANIRFYFGAPLVMSDNHALGSLCVVDREARTLSPEQIEALNAVARQVVALLEIRKRVNALDKILANQHTHVTDSKKALDDIERLTMDLHDLLRKKNLTK